MTKTASKLWIVAVAIVVFCSSCAGCPVNPTPAYDCSTVCAHGRELNCDWANWTPLSNCITSCAEWRDTFYYDLTCMSLAATCAAAEGCTTSELRFNVK